MNSAHCLFCGGEFPAARLQLGYRTCLPCGQKDASKITDKLKRSMAPAFNKGPYQLVWTVEQAKMIGRK